MKSNIFTVLMVMMWIPGFCGRHKKDQGNNKIVSVTMLRTPCFGRCPEYSIEIDRKGNAVYSGYMFVKDSGVYKKNIGAAAALKLIRKFEAYRVDTCKERYPLPYADAPGINYTIKYKHKTRQITEAQFGPGFLKELARDIDAIKVDSTWQKTSNKAVLQ